MTWSWWRGGAQGSGGGGGCWYEILSIINIMIHQHYIIISVFKFCVIWGIFLTWFADALLFDMMIKTEYKEPVNTVQDFLETDMELGKEEKTHCFHFHENVDF